MVDYVLTIAVSVASGVDALLSFGSHVDSPYKTVIGLCAIAVLVMLNLRGVKESVRILLPIFLVFVVTHAILIVAAVGGHGRRPFPGHRLQPAIASSPVRSFPMISVWMSCVPS